MKSDGCVICSTKLQAPIFTSKSGINSLSKVMNVPLHVYYCDSCHHVQTPALDNIRDYYDSEYKLSIQSEEEDQLYGVINGKKVFRTDFQARTVSEKLHPASGARVLDFGCAKSATSRKAFGERKDLELHVFDVSDDYRNYWDQFIPRERQATHQLPANWSTRFDYITSYFVLEHVADPVSVLKQIRSALKPSGMLYAIVPNIYSNIFDLLVVDHVSHFTRASLAATLSTAGLRLKTFDDRTHTGAIIFTAVPGSEPAGTVTSDKEGIFRLVRELTRMSEKILHFEEALKPSDKVAIYGAGFYGTFITTQLSHPERVSCYVDQNPMLDGTQLFGKPVVSPEKFPGEIKTVLVGLNPQIAKDAIFSIPSWKHTEMSYLFL